jgi:hypothetical protein
MRNSHMSKCATAAKKRRSAGQSGRVAGAPKPAYRSVGRHAQQNETSNAARRERADTLALVHEGVLDGSVENASKWPTGRPQQGKA